MKRTFEKLFSALIAAVFILVCALPALALPAAGGIRTVPEGYNEYDYQKCLAFLETEDENGVKNGEKLSENYDPLDPATWGTHEEFDLDVFYTEPTSTWAELDGELRLRQFRTSQWDGDDLVGQADEGEHQIHCIRGNGELIVTIDAGDGADGGTFHQYAGADQRLASFIGHDTFHGMLCPSKRDRSQAKCERKKEFLCQTFHWNWILVNN